MFLDKIKKEKKSIFGNVCISFLLAIISFSFAYTRNFSNASVIELTTNNIEFGLSKNDRVRGSLKNRNNHDVWFKNGIDSIDTISDFNNNNSVYFEYNSVTYKNDDRLSEFEYKCFGVAKKAINYLPYNMKLLYGTFDTRNYEITNNLSVVNDRHCLVSESFAGNMLTTNDLSTVIGKTIKIGDYNIELIIDGIVSDQCLFDVPNQAKGAFVFSNYQNFTQTMSSEQMVILFKKNDRLNNYGILKILFSYFGNIIDGANFNLTFDYNTWIDNEIRIALSENNLNLTFLSYIFLPIIFMLGFLLELLIEKSKKQFISGLRLSKFCISFLSFSIFYFISLLFNGLVILGFRNSSRLSGVYIFGFLYILAFVFGACLCKNYFSDESIDLKHRKNASHYEIEI